MTPSIHYRGEENNLLIANEYDIAPNKRDVELAKIVAEMLDKTYPGHQWAINANVERDVVTIHNLALSAKWGTRIYPSNYYGLADFLVSAKRYAGEILERYNVSRGRVNHDQLAGLEMDFAGRVVGDLSK